MCVHNIKPSCSKVRLHGLVGALVNVSKDLSAGVTYGFLVVNKLLYLLRGLPEILACLCVIISQGKARVMTNSGILKFLYFLNRTLIFLRFIYGQYFAFSYDFLRNIIWYKYVIYVF